MSGIRSALTSALTGVAQSLKSTKVQADKDAFPCLDADETANAMASLDLGTKLPSSAPQQLSSSQVRGSPGGRRGFGLRAGRSGFAAASFFNVHGINS